MHVFLIRDCVTLEPFGAYMTKEEAMAACRGWKGGAFVDRLEVGARREPGSYENVYQTFE